MQPQPLSERPRPVRGSSVPAELRRGATSPGRRHLDRTARWVVTVGGLTIIVSILAILLFIVVEVLPMLAGAEVSAPLAHDLAGPGAGAVVVDEYRSHAAVLGADGVVRAIRLVNDEPAARIDLLVRADAPDGATEPTAANRPALTAFESHTRPPLLTAATDTGEVIALPVAWEITFDEATRVVTPSFGAPLRLEMDPAGRPLGAHSVRIDADGSAFAAAQDADGRLLLVRREVEENLFTGETTASLARGTADCAFVLSELIVAGDLRNLYAGAVTGELIWWEVSGTALSEPRIVGGGDAPVTSLTLLIGDDGLIVGREDGGLSVWFPTRRQGLTPTLLPIREFPPMDGPVRLLAPSNRDKGFAAFDDAGGLGLYHSTSHRVLFRGNAPDPEAQALVMAPKSDGLILVGPAGLFQLEVDNPHPEPSLTSLFAPTHYEGYARPEFVWQSTGGTDEFEPKLSLVPLIIGTLKGTLYSLFLAIPLAVLGAMYTSQFMHPRLKRVVKPTVEIMAALPSVVLGFMAGLWLAPRVEQGFTALVLMLVVLPALVVLAGLGWGSLPRAVRSRYPAGSETLLYAAVLAIGMLVCVQLGPVLESALFGGDFKTWLLHATGLQYDQRNAIVVGLAMGFAVIPIIFSIAEDAFSNVPRNLVSGSLALGANRWQTVTRVVLPTASAGIFSAIMIGFGRAVGETMIVLMATGNTPIMDWNPFNGFRTLSANIAVEIPEAPHGGTLYRTLFLAALILFMFTFATNTVAELVRQRLRRRYAQM